MQSSVVTINAKQNRKDAPSAFLWPLLKVACNLQETVDIALPESPFSQRTICLSYRLAGHGKWASKTSMFMVAAQLRATIRNNGGSS
jgi:hypothetical protein